MQAMSQACVKNNGGGEIKIRRFVRVEGADVTAWGRLEDIRDAETGQLRSTRCEDADPDAVISKEVLAARLAGATRDRANGPE